MTLSMIIGVTIFIVVFIIISTEKLNKTVIVLFAGAIFIILGIIDQEKAFFEIDWNVIFLLISMMIIVGITKKTGLFQYMAIKVAKMVKGDPMKILILLSLLTAVFSALLDNVTTVMILTPVSILIAVELGLSPIPFVIAEAIASNIGGTATLIGDPPNIMIGSAVGFSFMDFLTTLGPLVLFMLLVLMGIYYVLFKKQLVVSSARKARIMDFDESRLIEDIPLLKKSLSVLSLVIIGFLLHGILELEPATISLFGAALLMLLVGKEEVEEFFHEVEWGTIFFFIGLFILVGGLVELGVIKSLATQILNLTNYQIPLTSIVIIWISGLFSAFVDNIPYVATMIPLVEHIGETLGHTEITPLWWSLALGSCFGGNGTLIGASANVVSVGIASKSGFKISFMEFTKYGSLITVISLIFSTLYIYLIYLV